MRRKMKVLTNYPTKEQEMLEVRIPVQKRDHPSDNESQKDEELRRSKRLKRKEKYQAWRRRVGEAIKTALLAATVEKNQPQVDNPIPIPRTYEAVINDLVYSPD